MQLIGPFVRLAEESESEHQATRAAMGRDGGLNSALDMINGVQLGTLADAWKPCPLIDFEREIYQTNEATLERRVADCQQASSSDSAVILSNLKKWREKWLQAKEQNASSSTMLKFQEVCESIRAKARLLYLQHKGAAWQKATTVSVLQEQLLVTGLLSQHLFLSDSHRMQSSDATYNRTSQ